MTQEQLQEKLEFWQKLLRIQDWDISIKFARHHEFSSPGVVGECRGSLKRKSAKVLIIDEHDYCPGELGNLTYEEEVDNTVVHELIHLIFNQMNFDIPDEFQYLEEQSIESIAGALSLINSLYTKTKEMYKETLNENNSRSLTVGV